MQFRAALVVTAATAIALAAACQPPPPALPPPRPPTTAAPVPQPAPTTPPVTSPVVPATPISCDPASSSTSADRPDEGLAGDGLGEAELGLTALSAAAESVEGSGLVEITTVSAGRPEFDVVPVDRLPAALTAETDPIVAVDSTEVVSIAEAAAPSAEGARSSDTAWSVGAARSGVLTNDPLHPSQWSDTLTPWSAAWGCDTGSGIDIAVVDTGIDGSHADLVGRVTAGASSLGGGADVVVGNGATDDNGHGTHVAGIAGATAGNGIGIAGVAPAAGLIPVRVLAADGSGWSTDVAAGIVWAVDHGAEVINLSLGSPNQSASQLTAISYADANGVVVVAAGGNGGPSGAPHYPAAGPHTIAVASCTSTGAVSSFSTRGSYLDVTAPGSSILSTINGGGYATKSGTSMATPLVSGVVALMLGADLSLTPTEVLDRLVSTATDAGAPGYDTAFGHGLVHPVRAVAGA